MAKTTRKWRTKKKNKNGEDNKKKTDIKKIETTKTRKPKITTLKSYFRYFVQMQIFQLSYLLTEYMLTSIYSSQIS